MAMRLVVVTPARILLQLMDLTSIILLVLVLTFLQMEAQFLWMQLKKFL